MAKINAINNKSEELTIDPGASGDSFLQFDINATGRFKIGVDDDDSDKFKISQGSALGSNDTFIVTAAGEITKPLTPAFLVTKTNSANVTGDGTTYVVVWSSEIFDQNADFDGTSTFTAPVTGRYRLVFNNLYTNVGASHTSIWLKIVTSNRTYRNFSLNPSVLRNSSNNFNPGNVSVLADMDASDTAQAWCQSSGSTKTVGAGGTGNSTFSGYLTC